MLSSKDDAKQENRFVARLDVLQERVDTLASTVATTASAIAKKDGEIAALQRALEARDQTLHGLVQQVSRAAESAAATDVPVDATELRSLRNAVAALTKERAGGVIDKDTMLGMGSRSIAVQGGVGPSWRAK